MFSPRFRISLFLICTASLFSVNPSRVPVPSTTYEIGDYAQGGVVFWLTPDQQHGLAAAIVDQDGGSGIAWAPGGFTSTQIGSYMNGIIFGENYTTTSGSLNSARIISVIGTGTYAANACSSYSVTVNGVTYDDWYLPAIMELGLMYIRGSVINATALANGGTSFASTIYWSSTEATSSSASDQNFSTGFQLTNTKTTLARVRAIRAF